MRARTTLPLPLAAVIVCLASSQPASSQTSGLDPVVDDSSTLFAGTEAPPVCDDGGPYNAECNTQTTLIPVDGSGSSDPDGTPIASVLWFEECAVGFFEDPTSIQTNFVISMNGECQQACVYVIRVTSGGQTTVCGGTATVTDTLAPTITFCPADVTDVWGIDTSPASTGTATAVDACDPAPTVSSSDVITPQQGPGIEQIITRTWTATDNCNHQATCTQVITLTSPSAGGGSLELDSSSCTNVFPLASTSATYRPLLLGTSSVLANRVDLTSLRLSRPDSSAFVTPILPSTVVFRELARSQARKLGDCNPAGRDGYTDFRLVFDRAQVISALGLDQVAPGTSVAVMLTGRSKTGTPFWSMDVLTVQ